MKLKPLSCSSTGLERLFGCLAHDWEARSRLRSKPLGPSRRFSTRLAPMRRCAKLQQNRRHHPTHLLWGHRTILALPWALQGLPKVACQIQLVKNQSHQPTPQFKLLRRAHMHTRPEQLLFEEAIAVLLREAATILLWHLGQGKSGIEHHEPTQLGVALGAFGGFAFDADHAEVQITVLLEMQVVPSADARGPARLILLTPDFLSLSMGFATFALKERTILGWSSSLVRPHRDTVELPIAFEPDQHAVAQVLTRTQELSSPIPAVGQEDDPPGAKERFEATQLGNGDLNGRLVTA